MTESSVKPYNETGKKEEVEKMFDNIAHSYDFLNHFFSFGIDSRWRKKAIRILEANKPNLLLDVATGTAGFAMTAIRMNPAPEKIIGVDISEKMLEIGRQKIDAKGLTQKIELRKGDSEDLPFSSFTFDAVMAAFGVRNFENLERGLAEMLRVLKPGGQLLILEFSNPKKFPFKQLFGFYFKRIMPLIGKLVSKDHRAYAYLPESVKAFPDGENFLAILSKLGFSQTKCIPLTGGIASIYTGIKKNS